MDQRVPITGTVTSTDGSPVAGAMIDPLPLDGQDAAAIEAFHRSLEDGRFEMLLAPGRWDLSVTANGYESISQRIEVPTAGDLQVAVVLAPA